MVFSHPESIKNMVYQQHTTVWANKYLIFVGNRSSMFRKKPRDVWMTSFTGNVPKNNRLNRSSERYIPFSIVQLG